MITDGTSNSSLEPSEGEFIQMVRSHPDCVAQSMRDCNSLIEAGLMAAGDPDLFHKVFRCLLWLHFCQKITTFRRN